MLALGLTHSNVKTHTGLQQKQIRGIVVQLIANKQIKIYCWLFPCSSSVGLRTDILRERHTSIFTTRNVVVKFGGGGGGGGRNWSYKRKHRSIFLQKRTNSKYQASPHSELTNKKLNTLS